MEGPPVITLTINGQKQTVDVPADIVARARWWLDLETGGEGNLIDDKLRGLVGQQMAALRAALPQG